MAWFNLLLKIGVVNKVVGVVQKKLNEWGFDLEIDNFFGEKTESAVKEFQKKQGLKEDGVVGPMTAEALGVNKIPKAEVLDLDGKVAQSETDKYLAEVADNLNADINFVKAISEVESSGNGFLPDGRPKILFERHYMYRHLNKLGLTPNEYQAIVPNIVNRKYGGYVGGKGAYLRLEIAKSIDLESAYRSISTGAYQIMGAHYKRLGFGSAEEMYRYLSVSTENQIKVFEKFIETDERLLKSVQEKDFRTFARIYNGPKHKSYDKKIRNAYDKFKSLS